MNSKAPRLTFGAWTWLWLPVLLWAGFIFYLSSIPHLRIVQGWLDTPVRKMGHMLAFWLLARLLARAFTYSTFWPWKKIFIWSLTLTVLYAVSDEYHQSFTSGRGPSVYDILIDSAGAWIALGFRP